MEEGSCSPLCDSDILDGMQNQAVPCQWNQGRRKKEKAGELE